MNHKRPPVPAIVILVLLVSIGIYFIVSQVIASGRWSADRLRNHRSDAGQRRARTGWQGE